MKAMHRFVAMLLGPIVLGVSLGAPADDANRGDRHDDWRGRDNHRYEHRQPGPNVEVIVDGLRLGGQQPPAESDTDTEPGATICRQAGGTTWSTRELPCEEPTPRSVPEYGRRHPITEPAFNVKRRQRLRAFVPAAPDENSERAVRRVQDTLH